jgi:hypothetical protein
MTELTEYIPPFFKTDGPVVIGIHLCKEFIEVAIRDGEAGSPQSRAQLIFGNLAVAIVVDALEQVEELLFRLVHEFAEFWQVSCQQMTPLVEEEELTVFSNSPVPIAIHSLHYLVQELVRIFQGYSILLATGSLRATSALTMIQLPQSLLEACEVQVALFARVKS